MIANIHDVARELGKVASDADIEQAATMRRLVDMSRRHGGDAGIAMLAGLWLGQGMLEHEIVARLWPKVRRFSVVTP